MILNMSSNRYHLAQINIARMLGPIDSEIMAGFVGQLAAINAVADGSPGFVWRLQTEGGDATYIRAYDDPLVIINLSIWESVEELRAFTYKSGHVELLRARMQWFERPQTAHLAMWWLPAGHIPSIEEAIKRLEHLQEYGESPVAFTFRNPLGPPAIPCDVAWIGELDQGLDRRIFTVSDRDGPGDCTSGTLFRYRQDGARIWATYEGGGVRFGTLVGTVTEKNTIAACYQHLNAAGVLRAGVCNTTPEILADGRLRLHERWRWLAGGDGHGEATVDEVNI